MFKKMLTGGIAVGVTAFSFAQDAGATVNLTEYMTNLQNSAASQANAIMPQLGQIAIVGLGLFMALWAFRALKRFLGR